VSVDSESARATTVYLVRHCHAHWSTDDARPLSDEGTEAARRLATLLSDRPIAAIYSSPSRRAVDTVAPLADRVGQPLQLVPELRERELLPMPRELFENAVAATWRHPQRAPAGAESNDDAQRRGLSALMSIVERHHGRHVVVSTHGTLMTLMLNGLDATLGFDFWRHLSFPDVYALELVANRLTRIVRLWRDGTSRPQNVTQDPV
jgi:2,3-bisphosphoglycerate-dependent phosphoglycerate mutase